MIVYDIQDLVKYYPGNSKPTTDHVTFQVHEGEIFGLLGDNGAGKSTLVKQMVNLQNRTSGTITLFGRDIVKCPQIVPQYVGYMPQDGDALNNLTVGEALYFTAHLRGFSRADASKERDHLLVLWEIEALRDKPSSRISGGQKRILRLAIATAGLLPILILDEPTNDLDPQKRRLVWDVLQRMNREHGTTIIFITHDAIEAEKIIQCVGIMHAGRLVALGPLSELKRMVGHKMHMELFFPPECPPQLPTNLLPHEITPGRWLILVEWEQANTLMNSLPLDQLDDFRLYSATLEDIYLHYVTAQ